MTHFCFISDMTSALPLQTAWYARRCRVCMVRDGDVIPIQGSGRGTGDDMPTQSCRHGTRNSIYEERIAWSPAIGGSDRSCRFTVLILLLLHA